MSKISADHLSRVAYVYVRQSTADLRHYPKQGTAVATAMTAFLC